ATSVPSSTTSGDTLGTSVAVPDMYKAFGAAGVTVTVDGDYVVISSTGVPDHKSPYFGQGNAQYEAYNGTNPNFQLNPNVIRAQQLVFRIPISPTRLDTPSPTPLGPIGVATNGVPIFNQYAANSQPLTGEIDSFDQYNGHPQMTGQYHYHVEPTWLTRASKEALIGVLLDGYPVYGPMENGQLVSSMNLDAAHGHFGATKEFPQGVYHYHTTSDAPYINGSGFAGVPGTVSQ
ncbi:MAG TPA: YHYH protein, partial [Gemmatimonadaceae bacterium]|nr:YHYH protein [Gemmatimonadaceae bacterium]